MKTLRYLLASILVVMMIPITSAQVPDSIFVEAGKAYQKGDYKAAADLYQSILSKGFESAELYNNLGNSYYKLGYTAPTILAYHRALRLAPNDKEIQRNLSIAQHMTSDKIIPLSDSLLQRVSEDIASTFSMKTWGWIAVGVAWACLGMFVLYLWGRGSTVKRTSFYLSVIFVLMFLGTYTIHRIAVDEYHNSSQAIVFATNTNAKSEPSTSGADVFVIHEGTRVMVLEELNTWSKVRLEDGKIGWIPNEDIQKI